MKSAGMKSAAAFLAVMLVLSAVVQVHAYAPPDDAQRAEQIVKAAETALFKVESFINSTVQNDNVTGRLESLGLMDDFSGNASILEQAKELIAEAKADIAAGNYDDAVMKAMEAMKACRDVFKNIHEILEQAGVEARAERAEVQGLLRA